MENPEAGIPDELKTKLADFDASLSQVESVLQPLLRVPQSEIFETLSPLDRAKVDLVGAYTINSLFWMYLNVCGLNPKEHSVKQELDRIRSYMNRVKQCQDKAKAPKLDKGASKRFVKSALWQAAKSKTQETTPISEQDSRSQATSSQDTVSPQCEIDNQLSDEEMETQTNQNKRKSDQEHHHKKKKKKKDKKKNN